MTQYPPPPPPPGPYPPNQPVLGYAAPVAPPTPGADVVSIAKNQRALMLCILVYLAATLVGLALPPEIRLVLGLVGFAATIVAAVVVFKLSLSLYSTGAGIVLAILTLVPCLGLFVLLIINSKATAILRRNGLKVGLLGADVSKYTPR